MLVGAVPQTTFQNQGFSQEYLEDKKWSPHRTWGPLEETSSYLKPTNLRVFYIHKLAAILKLTPMSDQLRMLF